MPAVDPSLILKADIVRENVCNNSKNVKSHVFGILKNVKSVKNVRVASQAT